MKRVIKRFLFSFLLHFFPKKEDRKLNKKVGIVTLLCHKDVDLFIYNLCSLFHWLGFQLPVYVVEDGSLIERDYELLKNFFHVVIEKRSNADRKMKRTLQNAPYLSKHRFADTKKSFKLKLDALLFTPFQKYIFLDADLLFPQYPQEMADWIKNDTKESFYTAHQTKRYEEDYFPEFSLRKLLYKHLNIKMTAGFSSGLMMISSKSLFKIAEIEKLFKFYDSISALHFEALEENAFSVLLAKKASCLSVKEYVVLSLFTEYQDVESKLESVKMVHYGWETKEKMLLAGINLAIKTSFFQ